MPLLPFSRYIPLEDAGDLIVCGAGPSGIAAAVSSARMGLKVTLVERYGVVGGNLTLGNVSPIMGAVEPGTVSDEIDRLLSCPNSATAIDPEEAKIRLTRLVEDSGVTLMLQCPVVDCRRNGRQLTHVIVCPPTGLKALSAKRFIDATGDGALSRSAGASVMMGRDSDGLVQPVSLMYLIDGVDPSVALTCCHEEHRTVLPDGREYLALCAQAAKDGRLPENVTIVRLYATNNPGERMVNATQANGISIARSGDLEKAEFDLRRQTEQINAFLRSEVPGFEHIRTRVSASTLGIRESRRIEGQYILGDFDLIEGRRHSDVVVHNANFCIDIHNPVGGGQSETDGCPHVAQPYDIPMRCLQPKGVENLITAGRLISGTHRAHASYRVMNIAMAVGQAAAAMAASSVLTDTPVSDLDAKDVQRRLTEAGCVLFDT